MPNGEPVSKARVGACAESITEALLKARPDFAQRELVDDLQVTALYAECTQESVCLLAYDVCEIPRAEAPELRAAVGAELGIPPACVHVYCTHTHSSSMDKGEHDFDLLLARSRKAAHEAKASCVAASGVDFLRVDTGTKYSINRRTRDGALGAFCFMQSRGCVDDGHVVDGTEWVRHRFAQWGAAPAEVASVTGPYLADRPNDPYLDLVLFPRSDGRYVGGFVRFTAHAVICSAGYWRPNLGRDYPGVLCDRLQEAFGCPILFLQGPCGDHRTRHTDVGTEERDRIGNGLADELLQERERLERHRFHKLRNMARSVKCRTRAGFPESRKEADEQAKQARREVERLAPGPESLRRRKELVETAAFLEHAGAMYDGYPYMLPGEAEAKSANLDISRISFGDVDLFNFPGELFSTVASGLESEVCGPAVIASFADGVGGYLMPEPDFYGGGGYEFTWALYRPEDIWGLRTAMLELVGLW